MSETYSFYIGEYDRELKQHINLSDPAWLVIDEDIKNFYGSEKDESFAGFLNTVFKNFYQKAEASIKLRTMEKKASFEKIYSSGEFSSFNRETVAMFIEKFTEVYEAELVEKAHSHPKGQGRKFRINEKNLDILRDSLEASNYEGVIGLYLKAVSEEYVTQPNYIREQIFFQDTVNIIQSAISKQVKVKIKLKDTMTSSGDRKYSKKFYLSPYRIVQDKTNTFNYVIGYTEEIVDKIETDEKGKTRKTSILKDKNPACFRLSRIEKCDIQVSMGAKISNERSAQLEKMLVERGAMYMSSEPIDIKIRFTEKGLEAFKRQLYMRPQFYSIDRNDKHLYTFRCPELQAMNYFFKFGWDAYVLDPPELTKKFKTRYEHALKTYNGMTKEEISESEKNNQDI